MGRLLFALACPTLVAAALLACGDDGGGANQPDAGSDVAEPARCTSSGECSATGTVCRNNLCTSPPECADITTCAPGENCLDGFCAYDPEVCNSDGDCEEPDTICELGECRPGCRSNADCADSELCSDDLECVLRPCTEIGCDDTHECNAISGQCELRPCNGGCQEPLQCRIEDDTCVECFANEVCGEGEFCAPDGFCTAEPCQGHDECAEGTFCIDGACEPPPDCEDDDLEENDAWGTGTILAEGTHDGFVSCPYDDDYHQVVADGDHSLTVVLRFDHEVGNLDLELFNTVGVTFARRASLDDDEELTVNIFSTGIYAVRVVQADGGTEGVPYELEISTGTSVPVAPDLCFDDGFEPNEDGDAATPIFTGRWTGPTICAGDHDYYTLRAEAGELLRVCVTPSDLFGVPLGIEILNSFGVELLSDAGLTEFCIEEDLLESDDWLFHVFGLNDTDETAYHIEFFVDPGCRIFDDAFDQDGLNNQIPLDGQCPVDPPCEDGLICIAGSCLATVPPATPTELRACPNNPDFWPVQLYRRDQLAATIDFVDADGDLQMALHRPSGSVILSSTGSGDQEAINYQAELDGIHYLRVYGQSGAMGPYTFSYTIDPWCEEDGREENDTSDAASPIEAAGTVSDLWRCPGDDDWYRFAIPEGTNATAITFRTEFIPADGALEMEVVPFGGEPIAGSNESGARVVALTNDDVLEGEDAPYLIRVHGAEAAQNTYSLAIEVGTE